MGLEHQRAGPVFPNILLRQRKPTVLAECEALLRQRRTRHRAAKALQLGAVVTVDELLGLDADAQRFGDELLFDAPESAKAAWSSHGLVPPCLRKA